MATKEEIAALNRIIENPNTSDQVRKMMQKKKDELMIDQFGEEFMESADKGSIKEYFEFKKGDKAFLNVSASSDPKNYFWAEVTIHSLHPTKVLMPSGEIVTLTATDETKRLKKEPPSMRNAESKGSKTKKEPITRKSFKLDKNEEFALTLMPASQRKAVTSQSAEAKKAALKNLGDAASEIPDLYAQDGKGLDATIYLHYFSSNSDWYITELDKTTLEGFGYVILNGDLVMAEFGYIPLQMFTEGQLKANINLDQYWTRKTVNEMLSEKQGKSAEPTEQLEVEASARELTEQKEKYPIVLEWTEGSETDVNRGFKNIKDLESALKSYGFTDKPTATYIKNKIHFKGYPNYVQIDLSKMPGDFNPEKESLISWLTNYDDKFDWKQFDSSTSSGSKSTALSKAEMSLIKQLEFPENHPVLVCSVDSPQFCSAAREFLFSLKAPLSKKHSDYFEKSDNAEVIPVTDIIPKKTYQKTDKAVLKAKNYLVLAKEGDIPKRKPITVKRLPDNKYQIIDGDATFAVFKHDTGLSDIYANVVSSTNQNQSAEEEYDCDELIQEKKQATEKKREYDEKRAKKRESTKNVERVEKTVSIVEESIDLRLEKGKAISKSEAEAMLKQIEPLVTLLRKIIKEG